MKRSSQSTIQARSWPSTKWGSLCSISQGSFTIRQLSSLCLHLTPSKCPASAPLECSSLRGLISLLSGLCEVTPPARHPRAAAQTTLHASTLFSVLALLLGDYCPFLSSARLPREGRICLWLCSKYLLMIVQLPSDSQVHGKPDMSSLVTFLVFLFIAVTKQSKNTQEFESFLFIRWQTEVTRMR